MVESARPAFIQTAHVPMSTPLENNWSEDSCPNPAWKRDGPSAAPARDLHSDQSWFCFAIGTSFPCEVALDTFHAEGHGAVERHIDTMLFRKSHNATIDIIDLGAALCKNVVAHAALIGLV